MDPSSDPPLHFHHPRQGQRMGPSQPSGSSSSPSSSHSQGPASPSGSTAASSSPFVRSHHDDLPASRSETGQSALELNHPRHRNQQPHSAFDTDRRSSPSLSRTASSTSLTDENNVLVAIKCPSLDKDSAVVRVRSTDTVLALKQTIQSTWPGAPRAEGMRCIRSGRILSDTEVFSQLAETLDEAEPLSLHLVIRPDAWSDPQNRPTPSRRSSYLRQQQQQQQREHSLPRSALASQIAPPQGATDDQAPPRHSATSTQGPSSFVPTFEPYFSDPNLTTAPSTSGIPASDGDLFTSTSNMNHAGAAQDVSDAYAVLIETLRVTAPENWPLAIEALKTAYDEYVLIYERIYNQAYVAQKGHETATLPDQSLTQSELLSSVETTLLGWDPVQLPGEDDLATSSATSAASPVLGDEAQHLYQQVTHRGLPYLLRISTTPLAVRRSEALATLLQRMSALRTIIDKLEYVAMLGQIAQAQHPTLSGASAATQPNGPAAEARTMMLEQGGFVASVTRAARAIAETCRSITLADASAVVVPMLFVGFKVGVLLSVMLRGADADTMKKYFVLGMASVYVVFESYRIVQRRMRERQRMAPRVPAPVQRGDGEAGQAAADVGVAPAPAPMGANVPSAPSHEEAAEAQATDDPLRPLPPPQAPPRVPSRTRFSYDWCIDHMAFFGLDAEDAELGLLPAAAPQPSGRSWIFQLLSSSWMLPVLLFAFTMSPAVEQRRKRAIDERERVIRKWTRLEAERRERLASLERESTPPTTTEDTDLQQKRSDYADRILRQRRTTEAVDDDELMARQLAQDIHDDGMDMNIF